MKSITQITKEEILKALEDVKDPEIPTISIVDLGIVTDVSVSNDNFVSVKLTPTFSGCPALKIMETLVKERIEKLDAKSVNIRGVEVKTAFDVQWNTNMITAKGLEALKKHGLAPPEKHNGLVQIEILERVKCPHCGSRNTELKTPFGPTLCRSMHYCSNCLNAFEQFKPVA
jgi:ring-1,2-phenylacetyl-CoA epoxidase subunit PaaD